MLGILLDSGTAEAGWDAYVSIETPFRSDEAHKPDACPRVIDKTTCVQESSSKAWSAGSGWGSDRQGLPTTTKVSFSGSKRPATRRASSWVTEANNAARLIKIIDREPLQRHRQLVRSG